MRNLVDVRVSEAVGRVFPGTNLVVVGFRLFLETKFAVNASGHSHGRSCKQEKAVIALCNASFSLLLLEKRLRKEPIILVCRVLACFASQSAAPSFPTTPDTLVADVKERTV